MRLSTKINEEVFIARPLFLRAIWASFFVRCFWVVGFYKRGGNDMREVEMI